MSDSWHSYPSTFAIGHRALAELFLDSVVVEEKIDGSQCEAGKIEDSPRDIGHLIKEVQEDIEKECRAEIAERLVTWAMPKVRRATVAGGPEWYKDQLLQRQFNQ